MTDHHILEHDKHWDAKLNLDSQIDESSMYDNSELRQKTMQNKENIEPELRINFEEVVSSNLSVLYSSICQEPVNNQSPHKIQFRQDVQENEKPDRAQNWKLLLPVDSNIDFDQCDRPNFRKPSLVPSTYSKCQKTKKSKGEADKFQQKQSSQIVSAVTEKHVRIRSQNTIKYIAQDEYQSTQISQRNLQTSFENAQELFTDLSRQFQYAGDFAVIRKQVLELAASKHLKVVQNTSDFVTIKATSTMDYCQCLIKSCINMEEMGGIYQLKNSVYKRNKAKFILITGNEREFLRFFRSVLIRLWHLKCLKLKKDQLVQFFVNAEKDNPQMKELKKEYTQLYNELSGLSGQSKSSGKSHSQSLIASIKENISKLRPSSQKKISQKITSKFRQVLDYNQKVNTQFTALKQKLLALEQSHEYDTMSMEKELETEVYFHEFPVWKLFGFFYKAEYEGFTAKCAEILKAYSRRRIFSFLEIQEQYSLFLVQRGRIASQKQCQQGQQKVKSCQLLSKQLPDPQTSPIPYEQCIELIQSMDRCSLIPSKFLQKASLFYKQLKESYAQLYSEKSVVRTCSMDDELPVTIFILLMADLGERSAAMNLLGKVKWMIKWVEWQESSGEGQMQRESGSTDTREQFAQKKKILTMLDAAFVFIIKEWKLHQQQQDKKTQTLKQRQSEQDQKMSCDEKSQ